MVTTRILFVCIGNICRSPMAEAMVNQLGDGEVRAESAGIAALDGRTPGPNVVLAARERGFDVTHHRARRVGDVDLDPFDRIVALEPIVAAALRDRFGVRTEKLVTLDVEDPYGGPMDEHRACAEKVEVIVRELLGRIHANNRDRESATGR